MENQEVSNELVLSEDLFKKLDLKGKVNYTIDQRVQAATYWMLGKSSRDIEKILGIKATTVRFWMRQDWWKELLREIRKAKQEDLDNQITRIVHQATLQLEDRIKNGNYKYNPNTGEVVRIPLSSSELAKDGLGIPFDKRALLRGDPTQKTQHEHINADGMLNKLAETFLKIVQENQPKPIEGEVITEESIEEGEIIKE